MKPDSSLILAPRSVPAVVCVSLPRWACPSSPRRRTDDNSNHRKGALEAQASSGTAPLSGPAPNLPGIVKPLFPWNEGARSCRACRVLEDGLGRLLAGHVDGR